MTLSSCGTRSRLHVACRGDPRTLPKLGDLFAPVLKLKQKLPEDLARRLPGSPEVSLPKTPRSLEQYDAKRNFSKTPEPDRRTCRDEAVREDDAALSSRSMRPATCITTSGSKCMMS